MHIAADLDGTLLDNESFKHLLAQPTRDLDAYHLLAATAPVNVGILALATAGERLTVITHREEKWRSTTEVWLNRNNIPFHELVMREDGDPRPAWQIKLPWLIDNDVNLVLEDNKKTLLAVRWAGIEAIGCPL